MSITLDEITVIDEQDTQGPADWRPIGHIAELEWLMLSDQEREHTRPTRALCGAEILGIIAEDDHAKCEVCQELVKPLIAMIEASR